jgi:hypothetical protein
MEIDVTFFKALIEMDSESEDFGRIDSPGDFGEFRGRKLAQADTEPIKLKFKPQSDFPQLLMSRS